MSDNPRIDRLDDIADRMFPAHDDQPTMTDEEIAATATAIVDRVLRRRRARHHADAGTTICATDHTSDP